MVKITINLATRRYPGKGVETALPAVIILLSLILFLYLSRKAGEYNDAGERVEKRIAELTELQGKKIDTAKETEASTIGLTVAGEIIEKKGFSWIGALDNLEKAIPPGISLSSIHPSFKEEGIKLSGYARDFSALSRFIDNLEGLKVYKRVFLINHSLKEMDDGRRAVVFNISIEGGK